MHQANWTEYSLKVYMGRFGNFVRRQDIVQSSGSQPGPTQEPKKNIFSQGNSKTSLSFLKPLLPLLPGLFCQETALSRRVVCDLLPIFHHCMASSFYKFMHDLVKRFCNPFTGISVEEVFLSSPVLFESHSLFGPQLFTIQKVSTVVWVFRFVMTLQIEPFKFHLTKKNLCSQSTLYARYSSSYLLHTRFPSVPSVKVRYLR